MVERRGINYYRGSILSQASFLSSTVLANGNLEEQCPVTIVDVRQHRILMGTAGPGQPNCLVHARLLSLQWF